MVRRKLLMATSTFLTCGLLLDTWAQYSAAENTRASVEIRSYRLSKLYQRDDGIVRHKI